MNQDILESQLSSLTPRRHSTGLKSRTFAHPKAPVSREWPVSWALASLTLLLFLGSQRWLPIVPMQGYEAPIAGLQSDLLSSKMDWADRNPEPLREIQTLADMKAPTPFPPGTSRLLAGFHSPMNQFQASIQSTLEWTNPEVSPSTTRFDFAPGSSNHMELGPLINTGRVRTWRL